MCLKCLVRVSRACRRERADGAPPRADLGLIRPDRDKQSLGYSALLTHPTGNDSLRPPTPKRRSHQRHLRAASNQLGKAAPALQEARIAHTRAAAAIRTSVSGRTVRSAAVTAVPAVGITPPPSDEHHPSPLATRFHAQTWVVLDRRSQPARCWTGSGAALQEGQPLPGVLRSAVRPGSRLTSHNGCQTAPGGRISESAGRLMTLSWTTGAS